MDKSVDAMPSRRIGVFSLRQSFGQVSRCVGYELEDLILEELEPGSTLIEPPSDGRARAFRTKRFLRNNNLPLADFDFGGQTRSIGRDLDLFFFSPALAYDLFALDTMPDWRNRSAKAVCFLQELWLPEIDSRMAAVGTHLNQFDHVICGFYHKIGRAHV